jgi:predicted nucleic-acid-binding protein
VIAPDTNVLVRLLIVDDAAQSARARSIFEQGDILILKTVLLEAEWMLRSGVPGHTGIGPTVLDFTNIQLALSAGRA